MQLRQRNLRQECIREDKELHKKDKKHFNTQDGQRGPLESIFRQTNFKGLVFGTFGEMSSNVLDLVALVAVDYGTAEM